VAQVKPDLMASVSAEDAEDMNSYAALLGLEKYMEEGIDSEIEHLICEAFTNGSDTSVSGSHSSRSQTYSRSSNRSNEMPDSELSIGPGMYAPSSMQAPPVRSVSSQSSHSSYGTDGASLIQRQQLSQDPLGTYLHVPAMSSTGMPAPTGSRMNERAGRPPTRQMQPPARRLSMPYWLDEGVPSEGTSNYSTCASTRLMDQAFGDESPLTYFNYSDTRTQPSSQQTGVRGLALSAYGSINSINHTLSAVNRASMFDSLDEHHSLPSAIPGGMTPMWDSSELKPIVSQVQAQSQQIIMPQQSRQALAQVLPELPTTATSIRSEPETKVDYNAALVPSRRHASYSSAYSFEDDYRTFLSSPSDEGGADSPLEK
jgi:hypothetical protein